MADYRFSRLAQNDLLEIGSCTLSAWGAMQTLRYTDDLEKCCERLADQPTLGRPCGYVRPRLRRMEQGSHVIFYRLREGGILVSRILHRRMLPDLRDMDD